MVLRDSFVITCFHHTHPESGYTIAQWPNVDQVQLIYLEYGSCVLNCEMVISLKIRISKIPFFPEAILLYVCIRDSASVNVIG